MTLRTTTFAPEIDDGYITLLKLTGDGSTIRVCNWSENITSGGHLYTAEAFEFTWDGHSDDQLPRARVRVDNASLRFVTALRSLASGLIVTASEVPASDVDTVEVGPREFECPGGRWDGAAVELDLTYEPILEMSVPFFTFSPAGFPALHR